MTEALYYPGILNFHVSSPQRGSISSQTPHLQQQHLHWPSDPPPKLGVSLDLSFLFIIAPNSRRVSGRKAPLFIHPSLV